jgi:methionyl-tRNA formyltransferase
VRLVTLGNPNHPFSRATLSALSAVPGIDHVGWVLSQRGRLDANGPACRAFLEALSPDLLLAVGYGQILGDETLAIPRVGALNVHPSLLPKYRGLDPIWWVVYEGETETGVTVHEMTRKVDEGPILAQESMPLFPEDTVLEVYQRMQPLTVSVVSRALTEIVRTGAIHGSPQIGESSYRRAPQHEYDRLAVDWALPAKELARRSRVAGPGMNMPVGRRRIFFKRVTEAGTTSLEPGTILRLRPFTWEVAAGDGTAVRVELSRPARVWAKLLFRRILTTHSAEPREMMSDLHPPRRPVVRDVVAPEVELHPDSLPRGEIREAPR